MTNTHSIFWDTQGAAPRTKICDLQWVIGAAPQPTTTIASRPIQKFDFSSASTARSESDLAEMLSKYCREIEDIPEASFLVVSRELPSNTVYRKISRNTEVDTNVLNFATPMFLGEAEERVAFLHQCEVLVERLRTISQVVQLDDRTLDSFGDEIRNTLILSCTEVEAISKSILHANGAPAKNIFDFYNLERACRLSQYAVSFARFPKLSPVRPFLNWASPSADGRLPWYTSYNKVKHDRITNVAEGNLRNAISAVAGVIVLLCASYGWPAIRSHSRVSEFTKIGLSPSFGFSECYMFTSDQILKDGKGVFVPNTVTAVEYPFGRL